MNLGLRAKSALALLLCISVVLAIAGVAGWQALQRVQENLGTAFARNLTQYNKQRILAPVARELALSQRLADSEITRRFLRNENDPATKALFFAEVKGYQQAFSDNSYFVISADSRNYYFNDRKSTFSDDPRYALSRQKSSDAWFFSTMQSVDDFHINVDPDVHLQVTKVWFNVIIKDGGKKLGLAGTGLDLTTFLNRFIENAEPGVTPMIVDRNGAIQAHPNRELIDYASVTDRGDDHSTIYQLLRKEEDQAALKAALLQAEKQPEDVRIVPATLNSDSELLAISFIPELDWFIVTAVDLRTAQVLDNRLWLPMLAVGSTLLVLLLIAIVVAVNRLLLSPVLKLTQSARAVAGGDYSTELPPAGHDELGELTRAFGAMSEQVRLHTEELETKVHQRTGELVAANKKVGDSIQYASLIQNAILPNAELARRLGDKYFVLWRPRDIVGGDFYVFRASERGCLLGVVDCAGHGVPGAFMTMIAHAALDSALDQCEPDDPASLLEQMDERIRAMLQADPQYSQVVTHMDVGLAYVDIEANAITFAGAKVALYWCDGDVVEQLSGDRRAVGGRRRQGAADYQNQVVSLHAQASYYLTTDGLLDQAGGDKGFSFGVARFEELLRRHASRPMQEQKAAFEQELATYQGSLEQRDDITVLGFRFEKSKAAADATIS